MKLAFGVALLALASSVHAQGYPSRPVRLVVPFTPGGGTDIIARAVASHLANALGQNVIAIAKSQPGKLGYATPGSGTPAHLAAAWFASLAGVDLLHVPYKGAPEYTAAVLGNHVQIVFGSAPLAVPHVKNGTLKALGVTTAKRIPQLPQVPTIAESGYPGYDIVSWYGLLAPAKTPNDIPTKIITASGAKAN